MYTLLHFTDETGRDLFGQWLNDLADLRAQTRIAARLIRLQNGNFGDCKPVGEGVWELRIDTGPGLSGLLRHRRRESNFTLRRRRQEETGSGYFPCANALA